MSEARCGVCEIHVEHQDVPDGVLRLLIILGVDHVHGVTLAVVRNVRYGSKGDIPGNGPHSAERIRKQVRALSNAARLGLCSQACRSCRDRFATTLATPCRCLTDGG